jgi:hypothetical protein
MGTEPIRFPVYALAFPQGDRIPGPHLHASSADCATSPVPPGVCLVKIGPGSIKTRRLQKAVHNTTHLVFSTLYPLFSPKALDTAGYPEAGD